MTGVVSPRALIRIAIDVEIRTEAVPHIVDPFACKSHIRIMNKQVSCFLGSRNKVITTMVIRPLDDPTQRDQSIRFVGDMEQAVRLYTACLHCQQCVQYDVK